MHAHSHVHPLYAVVRTWTKMIDPYGSCQSRNGFCTCWCWPHHAGWRMDWRMAGIAHGLCWSSYRYFHHLRRHWCPHTLLAFTITTADFVNVAAGRHSSQDFSSVPAEWICHWSGSVVYVVVSVSPFTSKTPHTPHPWSCRRCWIDSCGCSLVAAAATHERLDELR